ncbi:hypothetical protein EST38_g5554 [Candolleomyces aberdarensis]|uniref:FAD/NAD(P)-binding domain-containing protein n=1 Tax=Candolleomyces aberdarensis TaxID=2316362 RepID=A0A4Q2DK90_9AGAR|nr:hypothetical protein EST38_g5554 [Candolleomyces aberdarensis]
MPTEVEVPSITTKVLVIGGGPGGSYAASVLAREGIQVTLLEATKFPRYHIGESMLPSLKLFLRYIDAEEKVKNHGFCIKVSVGIVMDQSISTAKKTAARAKNSASTLKDHYMEQLQFLPGVKDLIGNGTLLDGNVRSAGDYSYSPDRYSGDHFRLVGDAGAFIDPFFSSGVHLAILSGLTAALTIAAPLRGHCTETVASDFYNIKSATAYTRFLVVVMSVYRQIRNQSLDVLSDVEEDNFDRAFDILRPVIQGTADVGKKLSEDELQKTMDFCQHVFAPADNDITQEVASRFRPELLSVAAPVFSAEELGQMIDPEDTDAVAVINRINSAKVLGPMWVKGPALMENEPVNGLVATLERGKLGLVALGEEAAL